MSWTRVCTPYHVRTTAGVADVGSENCEESWSCTTPLWSERGKRYGPKGQNNHYSSTNYQRNISIPNFTSISQRLRDWCKFSCAAPDLLANDLPFVDRRFWIDLARLVVTRSLADRSNWNSNDVAQNVIYEQWAHLRAKFQRNRLQNAEVIGVSNAITPNIMLIEWLTGTGSEIGTYHSECGDHARV